PDFAPAMEIRQAPDDEGGMLRQYVPALYSDNPDLLKDDPGYLQRLEGLGNPELVRALKYGDWDIVAGGMFDDVWRRDRHVRNPLAIPESWYVYRSFDWGASKPFSVGWWAIADGTEAELPDGTRWAPPAGSRIRIAEWYGWNGKPNEGLRLTDDRIGAGIAEREQALGLSVHPGPADNSIFDADPGKDSIAAGINAGYGNPKDRHIFTSGDKAPGSRVRGWQTMRRMLEAAASDRPESPGMWVFNTCTEGFIRTVPVLSRSNKNPEDVDTDAEDHAADEARYAITWSPPRARRVSTSWG
ncbi:MAG: terminase, partial [Spirochaetota bacterium]